MRGSTLWVIGQGLMGAFALFWLMSLYGKLIDWFYQARKEAREKGKQIELGAMIAAGVATLISLCALGLTIYGQVDTDDRLTKLEQAVKAISLAAPAKPDQQGSKP